jgi:hypothetical protein
VFVAAATWVEVSAELTFEIKDTYLNTIINNKNERKNDRVVLSEDKRRLMQRVMMTRPSTDADTSNKSNQYGDHGCQHHRQLQPFPVCYVCGSPESELENPDTFVVLPSDSTGIPVSCADIDARGKEGKIDPNDCVEIMTFLFDFCACTGELPTSQPTVAPTRSGTSLSAFSSV